MTREEQLMVDAWERDRFHSAEIERLRAWGRNLQRKMDKTLDCRSEEGITVGLIDSIIAICRILQPRLREEDQYGYTKNGKQAIEDALTDLRHDQQLHEILDMLCPGSPSALEARLLYERQLGGNMTERQMLLRIPEGELSKELKDRLKELNQIVEDRDWMPLNLAEMVTAWKAGQPSRLQMLRQESKQAANA